MNERRPSVAPADDRSYIRPVPPNLLRLFIPATTILVLTYIGLPIQMTLNRDRLAGSIAADNPGMSPETVQDYAVPGVLLYTWVLHGLITVIVVWLVHRTLRGRRWARGALTAYLALATVGSLYSAAQGPEYLWAVILGNVIHLAMIVTLWAPPSVRGFFVSSPSEGAGR